MAQRILVTGGAGYVGSVLCPMLLDKGARVTVVDALVHGQPSLLGVCHHPNFTFVRGDVRDRSLLGPLVREADVVVPLAAVVGAPACDREPERARSTNLEAIRLLEEIRAPETLVVFPATNSGYGATDGNVRLTEESPLNPVSLYGRTKVEAEALLLESPNAISLRLATAFGPSPRMRLDLLVNHFVHAAVHDGYLVIFEKDFRRDFVHVRDIAACFLHCIEHAGAMAGRAYNVGLEEGNVSKEDVARLIQRQVSRFYVHYAEIGTDPDRRNYVVSNERLRAAGFVARRGLEEGIRELITAYRLLGPSGLRNA